MVNWYCYLFSHKYIGQSFLFWKRVFSERSVNIQWTLFDHKVDKQSSLKVHFLMLTFFWKKMKNTAISVFFPFPTSICVGFQQHIWGTLSHLWCFECYINAFSGHQEFERLLFCYDMAAIRLWVNPQAQHICGKKR